MSSKKIKLAGVMLGAALSTSVAVANGGCGSGKCGSGKCGSSMKTTDMEMKSKSKMTCGSGKVWWKHGRV